MGVVKTWNGIARASLKTWDGIAAASVKTINGFDATTSASPEIFGVSDTSTYTSTNSWGAYVLATNPSVNAYTCPGSGNRVLQSLKFFCRYITSPTGYIRLAIYDTASPRNLIAEGVAKVAVTNATEAWIGHATTADLKPAGGVAGDAVNLTGGTSYVMAAALDSAVVRIMYKSVTNSMHYTSGDKTAGFDSTLTVGTLTNNQCAFQAYVL